MGSRGPKSSVGLVMQGVPTLRQRLPVPVELTAEQAQLWVAITGCRPPDWFDPGSGPLLVALCRTVATQNVLAEAIDGFDASTLTTTEGSQTYRRLLALQKTQTELAIRLATSLRLSPHSRKSTDAAATAHREGQSAAGLWERHEA